MPERQLRILLFIVIALYWWWCSYRRRLLNVADLMKFANARGLLAPPSADAFQDVMLQLRADDQNL